MKKSETLSKITNLMTPEEVQKLQNKEKMERWFESIYPTYTQSVKMSVPLVGRIRPGRKSRPHIWPRLPSMWYDEAMMTADQMTEACRVIRGFIAQGKKGYMEINLMDKIQTNIFSAPLPLTSVLVDAKFYGKTTLCSFYIREDERMSASILAGNLNGKTQMFLLASWVDGKEYSFELDKIKMISTLYKFEKLEIGAFTAFDKTTDLLETAIFRSYPKNVMLLNCDFETAVDNITATEGNETNEEE